MTRTHALAASVLIGIAASLGAAFVLVLPMVILDLYQSGHDLPQLTRPWIDSAGVRLSRADALWLGGSAAGGLLAAVMFYRVFTRRESGPPPAQRS
ncbi:MAG: hypothetical protein ACMG5Z_00880 [Luteimonas sp.]